LKLAAKLTVPLIYLVIVLISLLLEFLIKRLIRNRVERTVADVVLLTFFSLLLFSLGWRLSGFIPEWDYRELFRNSVILISAVYILRAIHVISDRKFLKYLSYFCFLLAYLLSVVFIFFPNLNAFYLTAVLILKKVFISIGALVVFWELCSALKSERTQKALKAAGLITLTLIFITWILGYLNFNFRTLFGVAIALIITALLSVAYSRLVPYLRDFFRDKISDRDLESIEFNIKVLIFLIYAVFILKLISQFSNLGIFLRKLYEIYIINTDLVKISIGNIVNVSVLGVFLFSVLNLIKKLVKLTFPKERREVEGGSAEALIFNLGVLFNSIVLLSALGITWKVLLPIAGTLGVGIGFGLQTIMNNYISGFILLFSKKLKVGDIIELSSLSVSALGKELPSVFGKIESIGILSTIVRTNDGIEISIPNSSFINSPIVNFSYKDPYVRLKIPVGVSYSSDPKKVREVLLSVVDEIPHAVKFLPKDVRFEELGDSSIVFTVIFWINVRKNMLVKRIISEFYYRAWYRLKENGIEIPFPQMDVWFRTPLEVKLDNQKKEES